MPRLHEVPAMEPQPRLPGGLPHVAQLALPGPGVVLGAGAESPAVADLVRDFGRDELRCPLAHGAVAGGVDDEVRG